MPYETVPSLRSLLESCGQVGNAPLMIICLSSTHPHPPTSFLFSPHFCFPEFALPIKVLACELLIQAVSWTSQAKTKASLSSK